MQRLYPYYVKINNRTDLYQLQDGRFQLIKQGPLDSKMVGYKYVLVKNSVADYLHSLGIERVTFKPAIVWNRASDTEDLSYTQVLVNHHFNTEDINDLDIEGSQFLIMDQRYLFVTPGLKSKLEKSSLGWTFSAGLSSFFGEKGNTQ